MFDDGSLMTASPAPLHATLGQSLEGTPMTDHAIWSLMSTDDDGLDTALARLRALNAGRADEQAVAP